MQSTHRERSHFHHHSFCSRHYEQNVEIWSRTSRSDLIKNRSNARVSCELFPAPQPNPHSLTCLRRRLSRCTSTGTLLVFCRTFPRISSRLVSRLMFGRLFSAGVSERPSPSCLPTRTVAHFAPARCVLILWVIMFSRASSTQVLFAVQLCAAVVGQFTHCVSYRDQSILELSRRKDDIRADRHV